MSSRTDKIITSDWRTGPINYYINNLINCTFVGEEVIRYGVIENNKIHPEVQFESGSINLSYEEWRNDELKRLRTEKENYEEKLERYYELIRKINNELLPFSQEEYLNMFPKDCQELIDNIPELTEANIRKYYQDKIAEIDDNLENEWFGESYENDNDTYLIGDWIFNEETKQYEVNRGGSKGYAACMYETYTMVEFSKTYENCELCSPCFPNAGNLGSPGNNKTFAVPEEELYKND